MTSKNLYPTIKPSLDLNFARSKTLDPKVTFTRSSTASYYDGKTVAKAEENLLTYSEQFDNWAKQYVAVSQNAGVAPNGTSTAVHIVPTASAVPHGVTQSIKVVVGQTYTLSVYAKAGAYDRLIVCDNWYGVYNALFSLSSGTVVSSTGCTGSITSVGNGWYRCVIQFTPATYTDNTPAFIIAPSTASGYNFTADGVSGGYLWGAQLEQRSSVTAYTPTTSAPITNYLPALQYAASNVPRFDHDPITGESKGLLIEEARTNLLTYSEQFDNAAWVKSYASVTSDTAVSPSGTLTADKLVESAATGGHLIRQSGTASSASTSITVYAKAGERQYLQLGAGVTSQQYANFNLVNGSIAAVGSDATATMVGVGNGWYRCSIAVRSISSGTALFIGVVNSSSAAWQQSYTGNGTSGIYIWGAQLEAGAFPTSYIPTTTAQVTRAADSASMTGVNFSSWYRQDEGTVFAETGSTKGIFPVSYAFFGEGMLRLDKYSVGATESTAHELRYTGNGATVIFSALPSSTRKSVATYKSNDFAFIGDTSSLVTASAGKINSMSSLCIGADSTNARQPNTHIKRITYYPKRLTDAQLQALTV